MISKILKMVFGRKTTPKVSQVVKKVTSFIISKFKANI
jgi:hypothetical protein